MSSLKELTEDTTDRQDIRSKVAHLKIYAFFVFYQPGAVSHSHPVLQKMHFKLREGQRADGDRLVQLQFYNLEEEGQRVQGLLDLKLTGESKAKIVAYCQQQKLMELLGLSTRLGLDPAHTPIVLTYPHPHSDFATFTGWNSHDFGEINSLSLWEMQKAASRWIHSSLERVDVWTLSIQLQEGGRLHRQVGKEFEAIHTESSCFQQRFISHVSLGYHARLSKNYRVKCQQPEKQRANKLIYGWQSFKNFCCLKGSNMRNSTGVVSINYTDEKGESLQILKHLREYDGSEQGEREAGRVVRSDRGIVSLVIANIDRYHGNKLAPQVNCKPGDGRAEIIVYEGVTKCRRLASVGDQILLKVESEGPIDIQVGEAVYRCWGCKQLKIRQFGRIRVSINKQMLEC